MLSSPPFSPAFWQSYDVSADTDLVQTFDYSKRNYNLV